jgi:hypothetical protein
VNDTLSYRKLVVPVCLSALVAATPFLLAAERTNCPDGRPVYIEKPKAAQRQCKSAWQDIAVEGGVDLGISADILEYINANIDASQSETVVRLAEEYDQITTQLRAGYHALCVRTLTDPCNEGIDDERIRLSEKFADLRLDLEKLKLKVDSGGTITSDDLAGFGRGKVEVVSEVENDGSSPSCEEPKTFNLDASTGWSARYILPPGHWSLELEGQTTSPLQDEGTGIRLENSAQCRNHQTGDLIVDWAWWRNKTIVLDCSTKEGSVLSIFSHSGGGLFDTKYNATVVLTRCTLD